MNKSPTERLVVGCMTGTSLDGLDAALVHIKGQGVNLQAKFLARHSQSLGSLSAQLSAIASGKPATALQLLQAARQLGELHAQAIEALLAQVGDLVRNQYLSLIVAHGQTLWHAPREGLSLQLLDPWPMVRRLRVPVCYDLRQADLIAGGQGAPITPLADWVLYRHPQRRRWIVNLGGICNVTDLPPNVPPGKVIGQDLGPCNLLLDGLTQRLFPPCRFDPDGQLAGQGQPTDQIIQLLQQHPFFQRPTPRTTGREDFNPAWINQLIAQCQLEPHDLLASAVQAVAHMIAVEAGRLGQPLDVVLAGGGVRNIALRAAICTQMASSAAAGSTVMLSDDLGIPAEAREAVEFAILGALAQDGVTITLPQITGARSPGRSGAWVYP